LFDALATLVYRARWLLVPLGVVVLVVSYAGKDKALAGLSSHLGGLDQTESGRAGQVLSRNLANGSGDVLIVFDADTLSARGETRAAYAQLVREALAPITAEINAVREEPAAARIGAPASLRTFYSGGTPLQIAGKDPTVTLAFVDLTGTSDEKKRGLQQNVIAPLETHFRTLADQNPQFRQEFGERGSRTKFRIYITGGAASSLAASEIGRADAHRADRISLPLTLIMLVMIFGGIVAAIQPLFIGFLAAGVAVVTLGVMGRFFDVSNVAGTVTAVLGLGLSIDYALLMVTRFREEMRRGGEGDVFAVLKRTLNTAGRSVLFSGITVAVGLNALALIPLVAFRSLALAGSITAVMAILGALLVLPAVLAITGENIDRLNVLGWLDRRRTTEAPARPGFFGRLAEFVVRYPAPIALVTVLVLLVLALPARTMRLGTSDFRILPSENNVREGYEVLVDAFGTGSAEPIKIAYQEPQLLTPEGVGRFWDYVHNQVMTRRGIAKGADGIPQVESAVSVLDPRLVDVPPEQQKQFYMSLVPVVASIQSPPNVALPNGVNLSRDEAAAFLTLRDALIKGDTALVQITPDGDPQSEEARTVVRELREDRPPPPATALVGGTPASSVDYIKSVTRNVPLMVVFIFVLTYVSLWALLGSVTLPVIAFVLNVISLGASFGALVFIFQEGHGADILRFSKLGVLDATTPVVLFAVTFSLSMDYQVFLLSRIKEEYDRSGDPIKGVVGGLSHTAGIITGAAATLLAVLAAYGTASNALVKSLTVGMFIAVLVDATIVRTFLVPSVLALTKKFAWYSPPGLYRMWDRLGLAERE
jgi:uncharacterized membrane protein YdfJ with MMPL/SSD domain